MLAKPKYSVNSNQKIKNAVRFIPAFTQVPHYYGSFSKYKGKTPSFLPKLPFAYFHHFKNTVF
jgi:hypothetical protein